MSLLDAIWAIALVLIALSLVLLVTVVVTRWIRSVEERKTERRIARFREMLMGFIFGGLPKPEDLPTLDEDDLRTFRRIARAHLERCDGNERRITIDAMRSLGVAELCEEELQSANPARRELAVSTLGLFGGEVALAAARRLFGDESPEVRIACARILARNATDEEAFSIVTRLLAVGADRSELVRNVFLRLAEAAPHAVIDMLADTAQPDSIRLHAAESLAELQVGAALPALQAALKDISIELRAGAARFLGKLRMKEAGPALAEALADPEWIVRTQAAAALTRIVYPGAREALLDLMNDENWWVRLRAAEALAQLDGGREALTEIARRTDKTGRTASFVIADLSRPLAKAAP